MFLMVTTKVIKLFKAVIGVCMAATVKVIKYFLAVIGVIVTATLPLALWNEYPV